MLSGNMHIYLLVLSLEKSDIGYEMHNNGYHIDPMFRSPTYGFAL